MVRKKQHNIVILGAGVAGMQVAQTLSKKIKDDKYKIILIDKSLFHIFQSDLYEVATAYKKTMTRECLVALRETVASPINKMIDTNKISFIRDQITNIDYSNKEIALKKGEKIKYEFLAITLGAVTNYYGINGIEKHSMPLKTVDDAIAINCRLDQHLYDLNKNKQNKIVNIVIGGGGPTGVETAAELSRSLNKLAKKYKYNRKKIKVQIINGSDKLGSIDKKVSDIIEKRLKKLGINVTLNSFINSVTRKEIITKSGKTLRKVKYDILIWTGGIKINPIIKRTLKVNEYLQTTFDTKVFAAGDNAIVQTKNGNLPQVAYIAFNEGKAVAHNIIRSINNEDLKKFKPIMPPTLIPLGGRIAIFHYKWLTFYGRWCWFARNLIFLKYALSILPIHKAIKKWMKGTKIFITND